MAVTPERIEIAIDELVLHGFPASDRHRIGDALHRELVRLLAAAPGSVDGVERTHTTIDAGALSLANGARAEAVGAMIAGAVFRSVTGATPSPPSPGGPP